MRSHWCHRWAIVRLQGRDGQGPCETDRPNVPVFRPDFRPQFAGLDNGIEFDNRYPCKRILKDKKPEDSDLNPFL
jgi:hypothetical protein